MRESTTLFDGYEAIIGLECHAQLRTRSKMFCSCPVVQDAPPNTAICPICMGHPGTLPMVNDQAIHLALRAAAALSCTVHPVSVFSRKHYFYPDLPKGYQISQYDRPLATDGRVHTALGAFGVTRIHLEEDAGKMLHAGEASVVDWNRAGVPLIEIVSEPDMRSPEEAERYMRMLHRVLVEGGICLGDMEKGHLRCDVNISIHKPGAPWGTKVEIKNVNSFRFVAKAIRYEIERQIQALSAGEPIYQETRTWAGDRTVMLRRKEGSADYRYFPEPDLPVLVVTAEEQAAARATLPGAPLDLHLQDADRRKVEDWQTTYGLTPYDIQVITGDPDLEAFFTATVSAGGAPKAMASWVQGELARRLKAGEGWGALLPAQLVAIQALIDAGTINRDGAKAILNRLVEASGDPVALVAELGLGQVSDSGQLQGIIAELLQKHPAELAKYKAGNKGMFGFFMGQLMAATNRKADPKLSQQLLKEALG